VSDGSRGGEAPAPTELLREIESLRAENARLRDLLGARADGVGAPSHPAASRGPGGGASYDRLFPAQDFIPKGSFGNLIALPLQGQCRRKGTTVFLDDALAPFDDQWASLSSLQRVVPAVANSMAEQLREVAAGPMEPAYRRPFHGDAPKPPSSIQAVAGTMLAIDRIGLPPALVSSFKHLASLHNPEYYEKERLRLSTWNTPRLIRCYEETVDQLLLPRGLREAARGLAIEAGSRLEVRETPSTAPAIDVRLSATLDTDQRAAFGELRDHDLGVLVAPPGTGKTVVGCAVIAHRATATLILVDRQPLLEQWRQRLQDHLGLNRRQVGAIRGGSGRLKGTVDVAMVQSLARRDDLRELTADYGLVVVDECHHVPVTFERVVRQIRAPAWLGLTATPYRRDGLEGLITMYCGPVRHRMSGRSTEDDGIERVLAIHETDHLGSDDRGGDPRFGGRRRPAARSKRGTRGLIRPIDSGSEDRRRRIPMDRLRGTTTATNALPRKLD
jgi:hypothetical protein